MNLVHIKDEEFPAAFQEIYSYIRARKEHPILNCQRLLALLRTYCSLLLDPRSNSSPFVMRIGSNWYRFSIDGHDNQGNKKQISLSDGFRSLLNDISADLLNCLDSTLFESLINLFTAVIQHKGISVDHKFTIINAENGTLKNYYDYYFWNIAEEELNEFLFLRKDFIFHCIKSFHNDNAKLTEVNVDSLYDVYQYYMALIIKSYIKYKQFQEAINILFDELKRCDDPIIGSFIIWNIILYNNQFLIKKKSEIERLIVDDYSDLILDDKREMILSALKSSLSDIDLRYATFEPGQYDLTGIDIGKAKTEIYATIPLRLKIDNSWALAFDDIKISFKKIKSPIEDPIFNFLNDFGLNINGVPLSFLSDALQDTENSTLMIVTIDSFDHPDFEIINGQIANIDFDEIEAVWGRKYYPHKERLVKLLRNIYESDPGNFPFEINKEQINIDLISNYIVNYIDDSGKSFFHKIYTVTNPDSFTKVKTIHLEKVSKLNLGDEFLGIRELMIEGNIVSSSSLREFLLKVIELLVKKPIELRGAYKYLWVDKAMSIPRSEPDNQPLIKTYLQPHLEAKGIQISRETIAANGSLDYLCSYTREERLYKIGIELKNAHRTDADLIHGLTKQLPVYLKDEGTQDGIYLILWFKNANHPLPAKYNTPEELRRTLQEISPDKYRIQVMVIDCTKPTPPSKL